MENSTSRTGVGGRLNARQIGSIARREIWPVPPVTFTADNHLDEDALDVLVEFYVRSGVDGLFVLAYSGEAFELSDEEQLAVCQRVVDRAASRLRIVAAGNFNGDLDRQVEQLQRIADIGPEAVIVFLSTLPDATRLVDDLMRIADRVDAPLGVYECPVPEHRLLSVEDVATLAETGRFVFMKETSRDRSTYRSKLDAAKGSPLKVYQANWGQLPRALEDGCPGFCGIIANMFPELVDAYCNAETLTPTGREALHDILADALNEITRRHYPASMKFVLQKRGVAIETASRMIGALDVDLNDIERLTDSLELLSLLGPTHELLSAVSQIATKSTGSLVHGAHRPRSTQYDRYSALD